MFGLVRARCGATADIIVMPVVVSITLVVAVVAPQPTEVEAGCWITVMRITTAWLENGCYRRNISARAHIEAPMLSVPRRCRDANLVVIEVNRWRTVVPDGEPRMSVGSVYDDGLQDVIVQIQAPLAIDHPPKRQPLRPMNMHRYVHTYDPMIVGAMFC